MIKPAEEILYDVRELLRVPERWTKHAYARDASDFVLSALNINATKWCLIGAIDKVTPTDDDRKDERGIHFWYKEMRKAYTALKIASGQDDLSVWNDHVVHADVMAALDKAIELVVTA